MTRGEYDRGREKLNDWALLLDDVRESSVNISMLFSEATLTAQSISDSSESSIGKREVLHGSLALIWNIKHLCCML